MTVGFQTCLDLSYAVYGGSNADSIPTEAHWRLIPIFGENGYYKNDVTGFAGAAYGHYEVDANNQPILDAGGNIVYDQIVIAYRGTERDGLGERENLGTPGVLTVDQLDRQDDIRIIQGDVPYQFESPDPYYSADAWEFFNTVTSIYQNVPITITGHSSGGALAQLVAAKALEECNIAIPTYTFNAPGVQSLLWQIGCSSNADYSFINNYSAMNDWCGMFREHIGNLYTIQPIEIEQGDNLNQKIFNLFTDTHEGIFEYNENDFGEITNKPIGFNQSEGLSLWYYDVNNIIREGVDFINLFGPSLGSTFVSLLNNIVTQISEDALKNAVNIINTEIGTPLHTLKYQISDGQIIIGDASGGSLDGSDPLLGIGGNDTIWGNEGNDNINGMGGDDTIYGDRADGATIEGATYNDSILGGLGSDEIHGGAGNDTIFANTSTLTTGDGKNNLYGDAGNDKLIAGDNNDYLDGGTGNDTLVAGIGNDVLVGGDGDDVLYSSTGKSMLTGGSGNDTYHINMINGLSNNDFSGKSQQFTTIDKTTINDSDGIGSVVADNITLRGGTVTSSNNRIFADTNGFTYTLNGSTLIVSNSNGSFQINNFSNGDLGIHLKDSNGNNISTYVSAQNIFGTTGNDYIVATSGFDLKLCA